MKQANEDWITAKLFAMFKRTRGYLLLILLVLTGLAGRKHNENFTGKESNQLLTGSSYNPVYKPDQENKITQGLPE
jgi:hypothetical protein